MSETKKYPAPATNAETKPFWDAASSRQVHDQALHRLR